MTPFTLAGLITVLMLALLALRIPVAYSLLIAGLVGLAWLRNVDFSLTAAATQMFDSTASFALVVVPLFIAMGVYAKHGTLATDTFSLARRLLRRVPGGLPMATILACAGFAALNGSSVATVAAIGPVSIREMRRHGYSASVAAGVVGAAGTLGVLIPPSIFLVLYGIVAGESIGAMLIAGLIPGAITTLVFLAAIYIRAKVAPGGMMEKVAAVSPETRAALTEDTADLSGNARGGAATLIATGPGSGSATFPADPELDQPSRKHLVFTVVRIASLFLAVVGGIYLGIMTVVEAAAFGMLLTIVYFVADHVLRPGAHRGRRLWATFKEATQEVVELNAMVFALIVGATVFTFFLVLARVPQTMTDYITGLELNGTVIMILLLALFIPLGMFLDSFSILLVAVPLMYPVVTGLGYDGIWFGILAVKMIELGMITPPFGINAFVAAGVSKDVSVEQAFKGLMWYVPLDFLLVATFFAFPSLVLWLPAQMG